MGDGILCEAYNLRELQLAQLEILKCFVNFCERHHFRYYLVGGTLLGAVRHKGFIPWDDDIDVAMPRPDYESFLDCWQAGPRQARYQLHCIRDKTYEFPFAKIVDPNYRVREKCWSEPRFLWIDVFPLDGLPGNPALRTKHFKKQRRLRKYLWYSQFPRHEKTNGAKAMVKTCLLWPFYFYGAHQIAERMNRNSRQFDYESSQMIACSLWGYGEKEAIDKRIFEPQIELEFEGDRYCVPIGYDSYLRNVYGDYLEYPLLFKRKVHISYIESDGYSE